MTTDENDTSRVTSIIGDLINYWVDRTPDEDVTNAVKNEIHDMLEDGAMFDQARGRERSLLELMTLLGFTERSDVWTVEQAIFPLIDAYDPYND